MKKIKLIDCWLLGVLALGLIFFARGADAARRPCQIADDCDTNRPFRP